MPTPSPKTGERHSLRTRCVLWHAPGTIVPANLGASLTARPVDVIACDNPYSALAAVCAASRDETPRPTLLVLIEPATLPHAARVLVLAEQHVPHAARWAYEAAAEVKLRAVTPALLANLNRPPAVTLPTIITRPVGATPVTTGGKNGVHGEMGKSAPIMTPPMQAPASSPAIREGGAQKPPISVSKEGFSQSLGLTAEELAMLLADAPKDKGELSGGAGAQR